MFGCFRTYCDVLEEMRSILKTMQPATCIKNGQVLSSLIEELQVYGNRMEASIDLKKNYEELLDERKALKRQLKKLRRVKEKLEEETSVE